jgi:hypothetical protein
MIICKFNYFNLLTLLNCLILFLRVNSSTFYYYVKIFQVSLWFSNLIFYHIYLWIYSIAPCFIQAQCFGHLTGCQEGLKHLPMHSRQGEEKPLPFNFQGGTHQECKHQVTSQTICSLYISICYAAENCSFFFFFNKRTFF